MLEFWLAGPKHRIFYIAEGSHETPKDLANSLRAVGSMAAVLRGIHRLRQKRPNPESWKKLMAVVERTVIHGIETTIRNPTRCKCFTIEDQAPGDGGKVEVCEFKADDLRILFFREEPIARERCTTLIVTHCFSKKQNETPRTELTRFCSLRRAYYSWRAELRVAEAVLAYELQKRQKR